MADGRSGHGLLSRITGTALTTDLALLLFGVLLEQEPQQAPQARLVLGNESPDDRWRAARVRLRRWRGALQRRSTPRSLAPRRHGAPPTYTGASQAAWLPDRSCAHLCCERRARVRSPLL